MNLRRGDLKMAFYLVLTAIAVVAVVIGGLYLEEIAQRAAVEIVEYLIQQ